MLGPVTIPLASNYQWFVVLAIMLLAGLILVKTLAAGRITFQRRDQLLKGPILKVYQALLICAGERWVVFAQVRLLDIVSLEAAVRTRLSWIRRIAGVTVHFVLCDPDSTRPIAAVEIVSEGDSAATNSDLQFKVDTLKKANLPLILLPAKNRYTADEIREAIAQAVGG